MEEVEKLSPQHIFPSPNSLHMFFIENLTYTVSFDPLFFIICYPFSFYVFNINSIKRRMFQLDQFHEISSYLVTNFKYIFLFAYEKVHQWIGSRFRGHKIESRNQIHSAFNIFWKESWMTNKAKTIGNKPNYKRKLKGTFPEENC